MFDNLPHARNIYLTFAMNSSGILKFAVGAICRNFQWFKAECITYMQFLAARSLWTNLFCSRYAIPFAI